EQQAQAIGRAEDFKWGRNWQGRRGNSMTDIEEGKSVTRVLDKNTWSRRNMAKRQRKTFADV
ncbi:hypothetical protein Ancab_017465, partial [Ancistrocladus abbreviatus]